MIRTFQSFPVKDIDDFKKQMLNWASRFNICCFMDNHHYSSPHHSIECLLAVGSIAAFGEEDDNNDALDHFYATTDDWIFGHFNYEFGASVTANPPKRDTQINFPKSFLFVPEILLKLHGQKLHIGLIGDDHEKIYNEIMSCSIGSASNLPSVHFRSDISKDEYQRIVEKLIDHIKKGDCYEINFCQEFYAEQTVIDPYALYAALTHISPNPFSAFYRVYNDYLVCASPERYLQKKGRTVISQPIKGTSPRNAIDKILDGDNLKALRTSEKDRIENVMVVDLVRNDLSKICEPGSVKVEELFGIYTFPQVYQMISTISGLLKDDMPFSEILTASFPMGSMTGAPKIKVMQLIQAYEKSQRGIYSGSVGYITPEKDFDFNVVIRSIMYNSSTQYLSYQVGGGITSNSIPEQEYEECLLKAEAIKRIFDKAVN